MVGLGPCEQLQRIHDAGIEHIAGICLAPQFSELSIGLYIRRTEEARREAGVAAEICWASSTSRSLSP